MCVSDGETSNTENGIFFSRSLDQGATWETPRELSGIGDLPPGSWGASPCLATDRNLVWLAAWETQWLWSSDSVGSRPACVARSLDDGETWLDLVTLNPETSRPANRNVTVATGGGTWIVAWESRSTTDTRIRYCRSTDHGETWSEGV